MTSIWALRNLPPSLKITWWIVLYQHQVVFFSDEQLLLRPWKKKEEEELHHSIDVCRTRWRSLPPQPTEKKRASGHNTHAIDRERERTNTHLGKREKCGDVTKKIFCWASCQVHRVIVERITNTSHCFPHKTGIDGRLIPRAIQITEREWTLVTSVPFELQLMTESLSLFAFSGWRVPMASSTTTRRFVVNEEKSRIITPSFLLLVAISLFVMVIKSSFDHMRKAETNKIN